MTLKSAIGVFLVLALLAPSLGCESSEQNKGAGVEEGGGDPDPDPDPEPDEEEPVRSAYPSSAIELLLLD